MDRAVELYAEAPEEFVAARDALVRELKAAGDKEEAGRVGRLRRPTVPAWALNQLARSQPDEVARLLDAAAALQDRPADVRAAMAGYRDAAKRAGAAAAKLLRDAGREPDQHLADIRATLDAAGRDPELAAALREGRLERAGGAAEAAFPVLDVAVDRARAPAAGRTAAKRTASRDDPAAAAEAARAAKLADQVEAAEGTLRQRRAELKDADAEVRAAEKDLKAAERRLDAARKARERAASAVERAERDRRRLG